MSVIVIDPSARNLPEQVLKNTQDLNELQTAIDELTKVLPDIMGRSPATYVAPVALDSEAKPAGQYHLLFANTSYDVKNGDYVFCVFVHAASGNSYVGVLQVVNDTYASGQYAATVAAVTPNLRGNDGATGPQGEQGPTGPQGPAGESGTVLSELNQLAILQNFKTKGLLVQNEEGFNLKADAQVVFNNGGVIFNTDTCTMVIPLKATNGIVADVSEDGKFIELHAELYEHRVVISRVGNTNVYFTIYNRTATSFNYDALVSYLSGKSIMATGYAGRGSTFDFSMIAYIIGVNSGQLGVSTVNGGYHIIDKDNYTVTDTVEEI